MSIVVPDLVDPFAGSDDVAVRTREENRRKILTGGRYRLPNRDGTHKTRGWQRVTNLVAAFSDQFGLRMWEIEQVMRAIARNHSVVDDLEATLERTEGMKKADRREHIERFVERCKSVSGGDKGAKHGNKMHAYAEVDAGEIPAGHPDRHTRQFLSLFRAALVRHRFKRAGFAERRVLISELGAVGTIDDIVEDLDTGLWSIADLKTQKRFWTWMEVSAQEATYSRAEAIWVSAGDPLNERAGHWADMPKVRQDVGHVLWAPRDTEDGEPRVDVYEVDLNEGWEIAQLAHKVVQKRSRGRSTKDPIAWLRPAPPITLTEQYAAKFAAVDNVKEGRELVAECKKRGIWSEVLAEEARAALARLNEKH